MRTREQRHEDEDLVAAILAGDGAAFERLVADQHPQVFRVVHGILGDYQDSEDACQEVFVKAYLKLGNFRHGAKISTWLYRIAVNTALKLRVKNSRKRELSSGSMPDGKSPREPAHEDRHSDLIEGEELLEKILRPLPRHLRAVVILKECEGLTYREIARVLGCTQGAVEQRLHRAFSRLRDVWGSRLEDLGLEA